MSHDEKTLREMTYQEVLDLNTKTREKLDVKPGQRLSTTYTRELARRANSPKGKEKN